MVLVKLYGSLRMAARSSEIRFDVSGTITLNELLHMIEGAALKSLNVKDAVKRGKLLILINDTDYRILGGDSAEITNSDIVKLIPVNHGG